jgi:uncharacterized membrane protein
LPWSSTKVLVDGGASVSACRYCKAGFEDGAAAAGFSIAKVSLAVTWHPVLHALPQHAKLDTAYNSNMRCVVLCRAGGYVDFVSLRDMTRYLASNNPSIQSNRKQLRTLGIYAARAAIALPWSGR